MKTLTSAGSIRMSRWHIARQVTRKSPIAVAAKKSMAEVLGLPVVDWREAMRVKAPVQA